MTQVRRAATLPVAFFRRPTEVVAQDLLGMVVVSTAGDELTTARIVETEAYLGYDDPASHGYYREEVGGLMIGLFEPVCAPWRVEGVPEDFSFGTLSPDWDRMGPYVEAAMSRVPISMETGIRTFVRMFDELAQVQS